MKKTILMLALFILSCSSFEKKAINITKRTLKYAEKGDFVSLRELFKTDFDKDSINFLSEMKKIHELLIHNSSPDVKYDKYNSNYINGIVKCSLGQLPDEIVTYNLELNFVDQKGEAILMGYFLDRQIK